MNQSQLYIFVSSKLLRRRQPERGTGRATLMNAHKIATFAGNSPREMIISSILGAIQYTGARHFRIQSDTLPRSVHAYLCMLKWARTWKCELQFYANDLPRRFGNRHPHSTYVNRARYGRPKQMLSALKELVGEKGIYAITCSGFFLTSRSDPSRCIEIVCLFWLWWQ